jgi:hypothetical protein
MASGNRRRCTTAEAPPADLRRLPRRGPLYERRRREVPWRCPGPGHLCRTCSVPARCPKYRFSGERLVCRSVGADWQVRCAATGLARRGLSGAAVRWAGHRGGAGRDDAAALRAGGPGPAVCARRAGGGAGRRGRGVRVVDSVGDLRGNGQCPVASARRDRLDGDDHADRRHPGGGGVGPGRFAGLDPVAP